MRAACLIVLVALLQPITPSIYGKSKILPCCDKPQNRVDSQKIMSCNRTDDSVCKKPSYIVQLKTGKTICVNALSKKVQSAIKKFESNIKK
ncbi:hypothetical protein GDO81_005703 [Engystomops pustulosus]|uniref:Chemokine interleukin-8-like domain-containing protein n=1 Tax=Engystomops pustulosus TaxID=76066 RepID=A0AAV7CT42_ENGPU|nr:hypothetical protein GDO81_005703 [Engystomops pustulosus]